MAQSSGEFFGVFGKIVGRMFLERKWIPDYLKDRIAGKSKTKEERVVTDEDEEAYKEMMSELTKGKERNDV